MHIYNCVVQLLSSALAALGIFFPPKPNDPIIQIIQPKTSRQTPNQGTFPKKQPIHLIEKKNPQPPLTRSYHFPLPAEATHDISKASVPYPDVLQSPEPPRRRKRGVQGVGVVVFGEWRVRHARQKGAEKKATKRGNLRWLDLKD